MTAQDNQGRLPTDTETPQTPPTRQISLRVSCLQTQQLISQFYFLSFLYCPANSRDSSYIFSFITNDVQYQALW